MAGGLVVVVVVMVTARGFLPLEHNKYMKRLSSISNKDIAERRAAQLKHLKLSFWCQGEFLVKFGKT